MPVGFGLKARLFFGISKPRLDASVPFSSVVIGVSIGLLTALALTRKMASLLFRVGSTDPFTFAAVNVLVLAAAFVACWVPARRATGLQPAVLLRNE